MLYRTRRIDTEDALTVWPAMVGEQRTYAMQVGFERRETQPHWGDVVHFSSAKAAANAFVTTVSSEMHRSHVRIAGTNVAVLAFALCKDLSYPCSASVANAVESVERSC